MRAISDDFRAALARNSTLLLKATMTLADGTVREMDGTDFMLGTASFESATSSESQFDLGACVVGKCSLTLNNHDGRFDSYDFTGATVAPYVGKEFATTRQDGFAALSVTDAWALKAASDEMAQVPEEYRSGSWRCDLGDYTPGDGQTLTVRIRWAVTSAVSDDALLSMLTEAPGLADSSMAAVTPVSVTLASSMAYAGTVAAPRTALAVYRVVPQAGEAVRYLTFGLSGDGVTGLSASVVADRRTEWTRVGTYVVDRPDSYDGTISLTGLDNMSKLSRPYSDVATTFPTKPERAFADIFRTCGVTVDWHLYTTTPALNRDVEVPRRPDGSLTCLQAAAYLAQLMGVWVRCNPYGGAYVSWYDTSSFESESWLDGGSFATSGSAESEATWGTAQGTFAGSSQSFATATTTEATPYEDGDDADGGDFSDYSSGDSADGGTFGSASRIAHLLTPYTSTVMADDVVVTGVRVTAQGEVVTDSEGNETSGADGETAMEGTEGYVLNLTKNPFVPYGSAQVVATALAGRVSGMRFRPLTCTHPADPSVEAGDPVVVRDRKGNYHRAYATSVTLKVDNAMTVKCSAKSAARNSATTASAATDAAVRARQEVSRERTAREQAQAALESRLSEARGLYHIEETLADGSTVYYLCDKPTLGESQIIWKMNASAVSVSTDGGKTYATGLTADGQAVLDRIGVNGIDAKYINVSDLMRIGTDDDNVSVMSDGMRVMSDGSTVFKVQAVPYKNVGHAIAHTSTAQMGRPYILYYDGQTVTESYSDVYYAAYSGVTGRCSTTLIFTYQIGTKGSTSNVTTLQLSQPFRTAVDGAEHKTTITSNGGCTLDASVTATKTGDNMCALFLTLSLSAPSSATGTLALCDATYYVPSNTPSSIVSTTSSLEKVLTNKNFGEVMVDGDTYPGLYTGFVDYVSNVSGSTTETMSLYFDNGLLRWIRSN